MTILHPYAMGDWLADYRNPGYQLYADGLRLTFDPRGGTEANSGQCRTRKLNQSNSPDVIIGPNDYPAGDKNRFLMTRNRWYRYLVYRWGNKMHIRMTDLTTGVIKTIEKSSTLNDDVLIGDLGFGVMQGRGIEVRNVTWQTITAEPPAPGPSDGTPDTFTFTALTNQVASASVQSNPIQLTGIDVAVTVAATNGTVAIAGAAPVASGTAVVGNSLVVHTNASATAGATKVVTITVTYNAVTTYTTTWSVTTAGAPSPDHTPNNFAFDSDLTNQAVNTQVFSSEETVTGIDNDCPVTCVNCEAKVGTAAYASSTQIDSGQTIKLRLTSSTEYSTTIAASVTVGTLTVNWSVTTMDDPNTPDPGTGSADIEDIAPLPTPATTVTVGQPGNTASANYTALTNAINARVANTRIVCRNGAYDGGDISISSGPTGLQIVAEHTVDPANRSNNPYNHTQFQFKLSLLRDDCLVHGVFFNGTARNNPNASFMITIGMNRTKVLRCEVDSYKGSGISVSTNSTYGGSTHEIAYCDVYVHDWTNEDGIDYPNPEASALDRRHIVHRCSGSADEQHRNINRHHNIVHDMPPGGQSYHMWHPVGMLTGESSSSAQDDLNGWDHHNLFLNNQPNAIYDGKPIYETKARNMRVEKNTFNGAGQKAYVMNRQGWSNKWLSNLWKNFTRAYGVKSAYHLILGNKLVGQAMDLSHGNQAHTNSSSDGNPQCLGIHLAYNTGPTLEIGADSGVSPYYVKDTDVGVNDFTNVILDAQATGTTYDGGQIGSTKQGNTSPYTCDEIVEMVRADVGPQGRQMVHKFALGPSATLAAHWATYMTSGKGGSVSARTNGVSIKAVGDATDQDTSVQLVSKNRWDEWPSHTGIKITFKATRKDDGTGTTLNEAVNMYINLIGDGSAHHPGKINWWGVKSGSVPNGATRFGDNGKGYRIEFGMKGGAAADIDTVTLRRMSGTEAGTLLLNNAPNTFVFTKDVTYLVTITIRHNGANSTFEFKAKNLSDNTVVTTGAITDSTLNDFQVGHIAFRLQALRWFWFDDIFVTRP